jgi:hypothetical protein
MVTGNFVPELSSSETDHHIALRKKAFTNVRHADYVSQQDTNKMAQRRQRVRTRTKTPPDLHGRVALMLHESLLHVLMEKNILSKDDVLDAIGTVAELMNEERDSHNRSEAARAEAATTIIATLLRTFTVKADSSG